MLQLARRMSSYFVSGNYSSIGLTKIRDARAARRRKTRVSADGDQLPLTGLVILLAACVALPLGTIAAYSQSAAVQNSTPSDKDAVLQQTIHDYIIAHPEVIIESLQRAKAKAEEHKAELIKSRIVAFRKNSSRTRMRLFWAIPKGTSRSLSSLTIAAHIAGKSSPGCSPCLSKTRGFDW